MYYKIFVVLCIIITLIAINANETNSVPSAVKSQCRCNPLESLIESMRVYLGELPKSVTQIHADLMAELSLAQQDSSWEDTFLRLRKYARNMVKYTLDYLQKVDGWYTEQQCNINSEKYWKNRQQ